MYSERMRGNGFVLEKVEYNENSRKDYEAVELVASKDSKTVSIFKTWQDVA